MRALRGFQIASAMAGALLLLVIAGCGSSSKSASSTATGSGAPAADSSVKTTTYDIRLTHVAGSAGAANASGVVVLTVKSGSDQLCWSVSPVKSFTVSASRTTPTIATIQPTPAGTPSTPGVPLGGAYQSSACTRVPPVFLGRLEAKPKMFYLSIYNTGTGDAVRGQV